MISSNPGQFFMLIMYKREIVVVTSPAIRICCGCSHQIDNSDTELNR